MPRRDASSAKARDLVKTWRDEIVRVDELNRRALWSETQRLRAGAINEKLQKEFRSMLREEFRKQLQEEERCRQKR